MRATAAMRESTTSRTDDPDPVGGSASNAGDPVEHLESMMHVFVVVRVYPGTQRVHSPELRQI